MKILRQVNFSNLDEKMIAHMAKDKKGLADMKKQYKNALKNKDLSDKDRKNLEGLLNTVETVEKDPKWVEKKNQRAKQAKQNLAAAGVVGGLTGGAIFANQRANKLSREANTHDNLVNYYANGGGKGLTEETRQRLANLNRVEQISKKESSKKLKTAAKGLGIAAVGAGLGYAAYKHYKNKKKDSDKKD